jgi:5-methyltetrahydrofolate--homocysteine methyltransferase
MAMQSGLSCAIMNPNNEQMMSAYRAFLALSDQDPQCMGFIEAYANATMSVITTGDKGAAGAAPGKGADAKSSGGMTLGTAIERGMIGVAEESMREAIKDKDPLVVINEELIPALDKVGKGFEKGTVFLPQLLMSADAAKAAFEVVKQSLAGKPRDLKGKVIIATVKGDIHDIGKNIVKVMLENYGYDVIDLGKDVPPEVIVDRAVADDVPLIGLSALMTTTVVSMEETIKLLREKKPDTKVVVGGAVMTQEYADQIGADFYAKDAMATVRCADEIFAVK